MPASVLGLPYQNFANLLVIVVYQFNLGIEG